MGRILGQNQFEYKSLLKNFKQIKPKNIMKPGRADQGSRDTVMNRLLKMTLEELGLSTEKLSKSEVNTNDLIKEIIKDLQGQDKFKNIKFHLWNLPTARGDKDQIKHLFKQIIQNACLYNRSKHPEIIITAEETNGKVVFSFQDNGLGIEQSLQSEIFKPFNRGNIKNECKGVGLGLTICKYITRNHDGEIWVQSIGQGNGSTFYVSLPCLQTPQIGYQWDHVEHSVSATMTA